MMMVAWGQDHAGLGIAVVVGLQASEDQVELFVFDGGGKGAGGIVGIEADEGIVFQMDSTVGTLGQGFAQHLAGTRRARGNYDHLATVLFLLAKRFFQGVGVGFVHFVGNVFADPGSGLVEFKRGIFLGDLLHAHQDFHA
jgi:hypothetical protein